MNWIDYYLGLALKISERSHDSQTKHGCIFTTQDHAIVSTGYNGFPREIWDEGLPITRPTKPEDYGEWNIDKYVWMQHSERNAIYNAARHGLCLKNCLGYITGQPCNDCLMAMWQCGIKEIYIIKDRVAKMLNKKTQGVYEEFLRRSSMVIHEVEYEY